MGIEPGRVHQQDLLAPRQGQAPDLGVSRGSGLIALDGAVLVALQGESVEERTLTCIGQARQNHPRQTTGWRATALPGAGFEQVRPGLLQGCGDLLQGHVPGVLLVEVQAGLRQGAQMFEHLAQGGNTPSQTTSQQGPRSAQLFAVTRLHQGQDTLGTRQVQPTVLEGAACELTGPRGLDPQLAQPPQNRTHQGRVAHQVPLGHVLAGVGARTRHPYQESGLHPHPVVHLDLVQPPARWGERLAFSVAAQSAHRFQGLGPGGAHHGPLARAGRGGHGADGRPGSLRCRAGHG